MNNFYKHSKHFLDFNEENNVIANILRLRSKLNWKCMLPKHAPGATKLMYNTDHKNPLKV